MLALLLYSVAEVKNFVNYITAQVLRLYMELPEVTYLMGLFDVGGELMRLAISEVC